MRRLYHVYLTVGNRRNTFDTLEEANNYINEEKEDIGEYKIITVKEEALDAETDDFDLGEVTIREYYKELLSTLLEEEEGFSGKRPFGNSGWIRDIYRALAKKDFIHSVFDKEWETWEYDDYEANVYATLLVRFL